MFLFFLPFCLNAQNDSPDYYIRKINLQLLLKLNDYQNNCSCHGEEELTAFRNLFVDDNVTLFNDIMPDNNLDQKIPVGEYVNLIPRYYDREISYEVNPVEISQIRFDSNYSGSVKVYAQKTMSGNTKKKINYTDTFNIVFTFSFNYAENIYKITDISSTEQNGKYCFLSVGKKFLFSYSPMANETILINGNKTILDSKGNVLLKDLSPNDIIKVKSTDEEIVGIKTISASQIGKNSNSNADKNQVQVRFKQSFLSLQFIYGFKPAGLVSTTFSGNEIDPTIKARTTSIIGINIGLLIQNSSKGYWQLKTGFHYDSYKYAIAVDEYSYNITATDSDAGVYLATNKITNIKEVDVLHYLTIPLIIEKGFNIDSKYSIYLSARANVMSLINAKYYSTADGHYKGYYDYLFGITIAENGVYDFGNYEISSSQDLNATKIMYAIEANAGVTRKLNKRSSLNLGIGFNKPMNYLFNEQKSNLSDSYRMLNSLTGISNQYKISAFSLNFGYTIKL